MKVITNNNNNNKEKYYKQKCRLCQQFYETTEHIISACPILANEHTYRDMIVCVLNYTLTYARKQG